MIHSVASSAKRLINKITLKLNNKIYGKMCVQRGKHGLGNQFEYSVYSFPIPTISKISYIIGYRCRVILS